MEENPDAKGGERRLGDRPAEPSGMRQHRFAIAGQPFMHKIRVPQSTSQQYHAVVPVKDGVKRVYNLPEGLTWNAGRCLQWKVRLPPPATMSIRWNSP